MQRKASRSGSGTLQNDSLRYQAVAGALEGRIGAGEFKPLQRLPGEQDLAREFGVSRATIRAAARRSRASTSARGATATSFAAR